MTNFLARHPSLRPFSFVEVCDADVKSLPLVTAHRISFDQLPKENQLSYGALLKVQKHTYTIGLYIYTIFVHTI